MLNPSFMPFSVASALLGMAAGRNGLGLPSSTSVLLQETLRVYTCSWRGTKTKALRKPVSFSIQISTFSGNQMLFLVALDSLAGCTYLQQNTFVKKTSS